MKYLILKLITLQMLLYGQSEAQMQEIKKLAKNKGFTENQIQNTLKKNKSFKSQDFNKQEEIIEEIEAGNMPLPSYLKVHWDAKIEEEELALLKNWVNSEREKIALED